MLEVPVHPLVSPWGRFGLYSFFIDAPEPAVVDTGVASSPADGLAPAIEQLGRRVEDVRWILLTHGHIDHIGGAHALRELTGGRAKVVIHEADAPFLRSRRGHVDEYLAGRHRYLRDPGGEAKQARTAEAAISGELEPDVLLRGDEQIDLGGGVTVSVRHIPGHTAGSVAYVIDGSGDVFVGDSVQIHGAANGFPGYSDPFAARASLKRLRDEIRPRRLFLGHPYRGADGEPYEIGISGQRVREALEESIAIEARVAEAARRSFEAAGRALEDDRRGTGIPYSPYAPFEAVAAELGYTGDPALEPSPFFTTMDGYRRAFEGGA